MKGVSPLYRGAQAALALCVWAVATVGWAKPSPTDVTGLYGKEGAELAVLQSDNETLLYYGATFPQGQSVGTCECPLVLQKKDSADRWTLKGADTSDAWTLRIEANKLVLEGKNPQCCGAGWPGAGSFDRAKVKPLPSCKVTAPKAFFHASDAKNTQRKAYVIAGDAVQAYVPGAEPDFVPGRFQGPKAATVGLLKREQINCQAQASNAPTPPGASADVKALAGKWIETQREGTRYVIEKHCAARTPSLVIKPDGTLDADYGQEVDPIKITGVKPGSASGAYTLAITRGEDTHETLEWTVIDSQKGIIQVKGGSDFFKEGELFVRDEKKGALPVKAQKCNE